MDRRHFLRRALTGAGWIASGASGLLIPRGALAVSGPDIGVVKGEPGPATRAAVDLIGGMASVVKPGMRVIVKPNMSFPHGPDAGTNTHPDVIRALVEMCNEAGASSVLVLDNTIARAETALSRSGIRDIIKPIDSHAVFAINDDAFYRPTKFKNAVAMNENGVAKEVLRADVLIAAPTAKSHSSTGVSLSLKGMMGLVNSRYAMHRIGLDEAIVDLCHVCKAHLSVIDATYVLHTGGPRGPGQVTKANTVIASRDMVAADAYTVSAFEWYGKRYDGRNVAHIRRAHERGLGRMDIDAMVVEKIAI